MAEVLQNIKQVTGESLSSPIQNALHTALMEMENCHPNFSYLVVNHDSETTDAASKLGMLRSSTVLPELLAAQRVIGHSEMSKVEYAVVKTLTGSTPQRQDFLVTALGVDGITVQEKKDILETLGEEASRKLAKSTSLGQGNPELLTELGQAPGFVGPFCLPTEIPRLLINRTNIDQNLLEAQYRNYPPLIIADIAISRDTSLLFRLDFFTQLMEIFEREMKLSPIVRIESDENLALRLREP